MQITRNVRLDFKYINSVSWFLSLLFLAIGLVTGMVSKTYDIIFYLNNYYVHLILLQAGLYVISLIGSLLPIRLIKVSTRKIAFRLVIISFILYSLISNLL